MIDLDLRTLADLAVLLIACAAIFAAEAWA